MRSAGISSASARWSGASYAGASSGTSGELAAATGTSAIAAARQRGTVRRGREIRDGNAPRAFDPRRRLFCVGRQ